MSNKGFISMLLGAVGLIACIFIPRSETYFKVSLGLFIGGVVELFAYLYENRKQFGKVEFDLDVAIHLKTCWATHTPARIYAELKRRLEEHETYKAMLEPKNRCLRLNYHYLT